MEIDKVPFSVFGSYYTISSVEGALRLRNISGGAPRKDIAVIRLTAEGKALEPSFRRQGAVLFLETAQGSVEACFESENCLRFRGHGVALELASAAGLSCGSSIGLTPRRRLLTLYDNRLNFVLEALSGELDTDSPWNGVNCTKFTVTAYGRDAAGFELAVEFHASAYPAAVCHDLTFDACAKKYDAQLADFLQRTVELPPEYGALREEAAYLSWSSVVSPRGHLKRPAMYMSKNWMCNVWSWDHCFNALALCYRDPELSWDQFMVMFDAQDSNGALPDCINDYDAVWQFCKPPVHGWTLRKMLENNAEFGVGHIREAYGPLCRWTDWWFACRDSDGDGVPEYHHGNDSGWDNGTVFLRGVPVECPDLAALLVIQMDVLSEIAAKLDKPQESAAWKQRADGLFGRFTDHFITMEGGMAAVLSGSHEPVECKSLLPYISLLLGRRLPELTRNVLIENLKNSNLMTDRGLATEAIDSPVYEPDGYWRGPIWAPSTLLMVEGLKACGEDGLAKDIALKFIKLCEAQGFAENFDALTGKGLRDPAYTWTSSVFLVLCKQYLG